MSKMQNMVNWLVGLETKTAHDIYIVAGKIAATKGEDKDIYITERNTLFGKLIWKENAIHI